MKRLITRAYDVAHYMSPWLLTTSVLVLLVIGAWRDQ
jgi:hypothetical protein